MVTDIKISDFDYPLPDGAIPRHPLADRDSCRLLVSRQVDELADCRFSDLPDLLPADALLVRNDTRVINARVKFRKATGALIEVFLLEPVYPSDYVLAFQTTSECRWSCMVGNLKRWKDGPLVKEIEVEDRPVRLTATRGEVLEGNSHEVTFAWDDPQVTFASVLEAAGFIPIPPYLHRESQASDASDYQTVYARAEGSVAAPTAGLHFTPRLFESICAKGVGVESVTLHVGAGTFQPVKSEVIGAHPMHTEVFSVSRRLVESLVGALREGRPVVAVGTTSVRTLESLPYIGEMIASGVDSPHVGQWQVYEASHGGDRTRIVKALEAIIARMDATGADSLTASTAIMIAPGFEWGVVDAMVTNFHQPQSTLLLLVSSFLGGGDRWRRIYAHALEGGYRFLSYGDACYFERPFSR